MKQSNRILAYSALALVVMLAAFGAIAFDTSNVAYAQGPVPVAPTLTAQATGADTIDLSWNDVDDAVSYDLWAWDSVDEWRQLGGGTLTGTSYSHSPLTSGTTYYYQIRAFNSDGDPSGWSDRVNEVAGDMVPDAPVLTATAGFQQITVSWPAVTGATRYELWAWLGSWSQLDGGTLTDTSHVHDGLSTGRTYYYQGRAVNSAGVMSAWSALVSTTVLSTPNISAPTLTAAIGDEQVTLTWTASTAPAGQTIASYAYRYVESGGTLPDSWTNVGNVLTTTKSGLTNGTEYDFQVRAVSNTGANGTPSNTASETPSTVPNAPTLTATEGYRLVTLSWNAPANNGAAITRYHIEILNTQNNWVSETSVAGSATSYTDRSLSDSTVYTYRIIAENVAGRSSASNSADATTLAQPAQVPGMPTAIGASSQPGAVRLTWQAPLFNGGSPITSYEYRYKLDTATSYSMSFKSAMLELTVDVEPLTPATEYDFEIRAVNSVGAGEAANTDGITDAALRTPGPTGPTAVPRLRTSLGTHARIQ